MDVTADLDAPCPPEELFAWVDDLERYPRWLRIVTRARREADGDGVAWDVELRGRIGPLARSKRLRMIRTELVPGRLAVFERQELGPRQHSPWVLRAEVSPRAGGSHLDVTLHYGGGLWGPVLERMLGDEIRQARERLLALVSSPRR